MTYKIVCVGTIFCTTFLQLLCYILGMMGRSLQGRLSLPFFRVFMSFEKMGNLTLKQVRFIEEYAKCGVGVEAARRAGYAQPENAASKVMQSSAVKAELDKIRKKAMSKAQISLEKLLAELEEARQLALSKEAAAAMVSASMGKAKLLGLDKPKSEDETDAAAAEVPQVLVKFVE